MLFTYQYEEWEKVNHIKLLTIVEKGDKNWKGRTGLITELFKEITIDPGNTYCIELVSACTGYFIRNAYKSAITQATAVDPGSCFSIECYHDDLIDKSGVLCPAAT